jgi:hypothetical protein
MQSKIPKERQISLSEFIDFNELNDGVVYVQGGIG